MASGQRVPVDKQAKISFQIVPHYFQVSFLILPTMNSILLGNSFFKKHYHNRSKKQFVTITRFESAVESNFAGEG